MPRSESWQSGSRAITMEYILFKAIVITYLSSLFSYCSLFSPTCYTLHFKTHRTEYDILSHLYDPTRKFCFSLSNPNQKPSPLPELLHPSCIELFTLYEPIILYTYVPVLRGCSVSLWSSLLLLYFCIEHRVIKAYRIELN